VISANNNCELLKYVLAAGAYRYKVKQCVDDATIIEGYKLIDMYVKNPTLLHDYKVEVDLISQVYASTVLLKEGYYFLHRLKLY
jgi:hypothetical protein